MRIDPATQEEALTKPGVRVFDLTGRPMKGWILVGAEAVKTARALQSWVERGVAFASTLPKKK